MHDIVITIGVYALLRFEVSPATVIGLLTILGYSLYDTVVVFDKVRENTAGLLATRRTTYSEAANLALNQTLVRSINTSLIALLPVVSILAVSVFLLGNGELKDLSLVLFVGMLSGTYSSICIATPVLADLKEREPAYRQLRKQIAQRASSAKRQAKVAVGNATGAGQVGARTAAEMPDGDRPRTTERSGGAGDRGASRGRLRGAPARVRAPAAAAAAQRLAAAPVRQEEAQVARGVRDRGGRWRRGRRRRGLASRPRHRRHRRGAAQADQGRPRLSAAWRGVQGHHAAAGRRGRIRGDDQRAGRRSRPDRQGGRDRGPGLHSRRSGRLPAGRRLRAGAQARQAARTDARARPTSWSTAPRRSRSTWTRSRRATGC